jgi:hypothetical protein
MPIFGPLPSDMGTEFPYPGSIPGSPGTYPNPIPTNPNPAGGGGWPSILGPLGASLGGGIGLSLLGSRLGQRSFTPQEQQVLAGNLQAAQTGLTSGQQMVGMGLPAMRTALGYYTPLVTGDRAAMTSVLSPELGQIAGSFGQAQRTSAALSPRGGPSAAFQSNLPWQQAGAVSNLFQSVRPGAAQALTGAANQALGQGTNALYASTAAGRNILGATEALRNLSAQQGANIGRGLFGTFQQYGMPALQKAWPNIFGGGTPGQPQNPFPGGGGGGPTQVAGGGGLFSGGFGGGSMGGGIFA